MVSRHVCNVDRLIHLATVARFPWRRVYRCAECGRRWGDA